VSHAVRWGLLGTAHINRRVIPAMRAARRSVLAAVASRDMARAQAYAREWQIPTAHAGYDALLRDRTIDAVYVPLPNTLHVEWTLRAVDAGKHVLCEKPLALTADDVDRIEAVARDRHRVVAEGFMYRHEPLTAAVLALLADQVIGPLRTISAAFTFELQRSPDVRLDRALGGGSLWDVGCYAVNIARLIAGKEPGVALGVATLTDAGVDRSFTGLLQFPDGVVASIHSNFSASYRSSLEVMGASGVLRVPHPFKPGPETQIEIQRGDEVDRVRVAGSPALFVRQIEDFIAAVLDGRPPAVSLRDSRGNAAALAALHEAAATGRTVRI
jgi:D-xylose 1-dehydrogenase (NADP+, D-xylono-1,5-lactone-forming)